MVPNFKIMLSNQIGLESKPTALQKLRGTSYFSQKLRKDKTFYGKLRMLKLLEQNFNYIFLKHTSDIGL